MKKSRRKDDGKSSKDHLAGKSEHGREGSVDGGLPGIAETEESLTVKQQRGKDVSKETLSVALPPGTRRKTVEEPLIVPLQFRDLDGSSKQEKVTSVHVSNSPLT